MSHFVMTGMLSEYDIQGVPIRLRQHPSVFPPSPFGLQFAQVLDLRSGERVADIGTGTGLLGILAAKKGAADVVATDTCAAAVEVARFNARTLNDVDRMSVLHGSFFGDTRGCFDTIVANLPQEIVPPSYLARLDHDQAQALCGGSQGGNELLLQFLGLAPARMHAESRLYVIVNTVTAYRATLEAIDRDYWATLVWEGTAPTKDYVSTHIEWFRSRIDSGEIDVFLDPEGRWRARQFVYVLRHKR